MNNFSFISPTQFVFGKGVENQVGSWVKEAGYTSALLVYGKGHAQKSGLVDRVKESLKDSGIRTVELSGIRANPEITSVRQGVEICRNHNVDFILAVGGGSVIDASKAIAAAVSYPEDPWNLFLRPNPARPVSYLPVGVVLTIPAAGSEGSSASVISNDELEQKRSLGSDQMRPKVAFMNPELTYSLPAWQTAAGITDMCAHIFERFFSDSENTITSDNISIALLKSIRTEAIKVMRDPLDYDGRANIMWDSTLAHNGLCGCGRDEDWASHALEHEMSALNPKVTHGAGLAVIMPAWMRYVCHTNPERFCQLGHEVFGISSTDEAIQDALTTINCIQDFFQSIGMPRYMEDLGFTPEDVNTLTENLDNTCAHQPFGSFMKLTAEDGRMIYQSAFKQQD